MCFKGFDKRGITMFEKITHCLICKASINDGVCCKKCNDKYSMKFDRDMTPLCWSCGKRMFNVVDSKTGELSKYSWKCDCEKFPKNLTLSVG